jgi:hypothetical protein
MIRFLKSILISPGGFSMSSRVITNTIINDDALSILREMNTESVDFIITDPPYGVDFQSRRVEKARRKDKIASDKSPFIWWWYDGFRVLMAGGGTPMFQPVGCSAGFH